MTTFYDKLCFGPKVVNHKTTKQKDIKINTFFKFIFSSPFLHTALVENVKGVFLRKNFNFYIRS